MVNSNFLESQTKNLQSALQQLVDALSELDLIAQKERTNLLRHPSDLISQALDTFTELSQQLEKVQIELINLRALAEISQVVNSSLEVNEVLRIVMDTIIRLTGAERGFLMLKSPQGAMEMRIARNWEQETIAANDFEISRTVIQRVNSSGQPVLTTNAQEDPRFETHESVIAYNLRSILCVPLKVKGELTGVIYADNRFRSGIFTEQELDLLTSFANQAAIAIENARLFDSIKNTLSEVSELKNLMDNVFSSMVSGVITTNTENLITLCNQAAQAILEKPIAEILGKPLDQAIAHLTPALSPITQKILAENRSLVGLEAVYSKPNGEQAYWRLNLSPLKDANSETQGVALVFDDLTEKKALEAQRSLFEKMVSPQVISQLDPIHLRLGGRRTEISILFADIHGFTQFSENLEPEELVNVLNQYLAVAADAILAHGGTIDKFMGDAVMAWFNAPLPQPNHPLQAVKAALALRQACHQLAQSFPPEKQLNFGIGIHCGDALLGLIGNEQRIEYTALGDSVNTAKRIQENAANNQILISETVFQRLKEHIMVKSAPPLQAKGKKEPIIVYEVLSLR